jgi:hypothetical protein
MTFDEWIKSTEHKFTVHEYHWAKEAWNKVTEVCNEHFEQDLEDTYMNGYMAGKHDGQQGL